MEMPQPLIQIDADKSELGKEYPIAAGIAGDVKIVLGQLLEAVKNSGGLKKDAWKPILKGIKDEIHQQPKLPVLSELREVLGYRQSRFTFPTFQMKLEAYYSISEITGNTGFLIINEYFSDERSQV